MADARAQLLITGSVLIKAIMGGEMHSYDELIYRN
jgi:hypothetical protein